MQEEEFLARADAHIGLLCCQSDFDLGEQNVMSEQDLLEASLQPDSGLDAAFKVLVSGGSTFRQQNRYQSESPSSAHPLASTAGDRQDSTIGVTSI